jgi:hypothetical protein
MYLQLRLALGSFYLSDRLLNRMLIEVKFQLRAEVAVKDTGAIAGTFRRRY